MTDQPEAGRNGQVGGEELRTAADELRAAADRLAPEPQTPPTLTGDYPDLDACYAHMLRTTAETVDAVLRHGLSVDESAHWLAPALAAARQINAAVSSVV